MAPAVFHSHNQLLLLIRVAIIHPISQLCADFLITQYIFGYEPGDVYACVADVGWITGHTCKSAFLYIIKLYPHHLLSYNYCCCEIEENLHAFVNSILVLTAPDIVYGPLANGATTLLFESIPTFPDAGRYWQVISQLPPCGFVLIIEQC